MITWLNGLSKGSVAYGMMVDVSSLRMRGIAGMFSAFSLNPDAIAMPVCCSLFLLIQPVRGAFVKTRRQRCLLRSMVGTTSPVYYLNRSGSCGWTVSAMGEAIRINDKPLLR